MFKKFQAVNKMRIGTEKYFRSIFFQINNAT